MHHLNHQTWDRGGAMHRMALCSHDSHDNVSIRAWPAMVRRHGLRLVPSWHYHTDRCAIKHLTGATAYVLWFKIIQADSIHFCIHIQCYRCSPPHWPRNWLWMNIKVILKARALDKSVYVVFFSCSAKRLDVHFSKREVPPCLSWVFSHYSIVLFPPRSIAAGKADRSHHYFHHDYYLFIRSIPGIVKCIPAWSERQTRTPVNYWRIRANSLVAAAAV